MGRSNFSLAQYISKKTLPKTVAILLCLALLFLIALFLMIRTTIMSDHQTSMTQFDVALEKAQESMFERVNSIANNDLIVNSLIDIDSRDNYLPIFFRSLYFSDSKNEVVAFTDFSGEVITANNYARFTQVKEMVDWQPMVLEQSKSVVNVSERGLFIAVPVMYSGLAEGAIVALFPHFQSILDFRGAQHQVILVDSNHRVIFSNSVDQFEFKSIFDKTNYPNYFISEVDLEFGELYVLEPYIEAYQDLVILTFVILIAFIIVFFTTRYSTHLAGRLAGESIAEFKKALKKTSTKGEVSVIPSEGLPLEYAELVDFYHDLLSNLTRTTLSKNKFQDVFYSINDLLIVMNFEGDILLENKKVISMADVLQRSTQDIANELCPDAEYQGETIGDIQLSYKGNRTVLWRRNYLKSSDGSHLGYTFVGSDITTSLLLQNELKMTKQAIDEADTSIVIADAQQNNFPLIYVNRAFEKLTGYIASEVLGENCNLLQGKDTDENDIEDISAALKQRKSVTHTILNYRKDGQAFLNELTLTPIWNEQHQLTHYLGIQVDITERQRAQEFLREAKEKAEESAKLKSEFLASMSHEIRTPINGVMGMLGLMLRSELDSEQRHHANLAHSSAESLLGIINDILDFSKVESGKIDLELIEIDIEQCFLDTAKLLAYKAQEKGLELVFESNLMLEKFALGDPTRINQITTNLLSNAIKFTESGYVSLSLGYGECGELECKIRDTGIGISPNRLDQIFESFSQEDSSTTRKFGGTGLGLAISKQLALIMGGDIHVSSEVGHGSEFTLTLPLSVTAKDLGKTVIDTNISQAMLIDSGQLHKKLIAQGLGSRTVIHSCKTGAQAISLVEKQQIDWVFINDNLSGLSGDPLAKALKESAINKEINVLFLSSLREKQKLNQQNSLSKPFSVFELQLALSRDALKHEEENTAEKPNLALHEFSHMRVLLAEDNVVNRMLAKGIFKELQVELTIVENGQLALDKLNEDIDFDLILMDCQMPVLDGYQTSKAIRAGKAGQAYIHTPIIAMTANAMKGDRELCIAAGMNDYISKPIKVDILRQKLAHWLNEVISK